MYKDIEKRSIEPSHCLPEEGYLDGIQVRRIASVHHAYLQMEKEGVEGVDFAKFELHPAVLGQCIDHYLDDYVILKIRYRIERERQIQLHRVAGLLAAALMRYRPVVLKTGCQPESINEVRINEHLAMYVGINICSEKYAHAGRDTGGILGSNPLLADWIKRMKFFLESRNYTAESLVMIFDAICVLLYPDNFKHQV